MKMLYQKLLAALVFCTLLQTSFSQVINPADPIVEYTGGNVQQPQSGQIGDWVKTTRLNWNTEDYKCYIYKGHIFRLKFPLTYQHGVNDGKTYPIFVFFHGLGEAAADDEIANLYDNEYHLLHGGLRHKDSVNSGKFDGFLLYLQNQWGFFGAAHYDAIAEIIQNFMVPQNKVDINRIYINGLSGGGTASWDFAIRYPQLTAACLPISAANLSTRNYVNSLKFIPIWHFQGGQDRNPAPVTSENVGQSIINVGGSYKYTKYPNRGHGCWNDAWSEPDFHNFMLRAHKANPVPLFGKYEFCVGETPNVTLGLSPGFTAYEWRRNGVVIPGATSNEYTVSSYGTYEARIRRGNNWSPWSPNPIVVKLKDPTVPPDIQTKGLMSHALPAPDGSTSVTLSEQAGFLSYSWTRQGNAQVLGAADSLVVTTPGTYLVKVTEQFGCLSEFSPPFVVVDANGPNKPDAPANVVASAISMTQMKIDWTDNPAPVNNETNFEIYQATSPGGPYSLMGITGQDVNTFSIGGLIEGTRYYYIMRAYNNTGASAVSPEIYGVTIPDAEAPTAPGNLHIINVNSNSVGLSWTPSTDNVGVVNYDIYINDIKSYVTTSSTFTCFNLSLADSGYAFVVKARDAAGNSSVPSNMVFGLPPVNVPPAPAAPTNLVATPVSHNTINLTWADNSNNETGFEIFRSTNPNSGFYSIKIVAAGATSYSDNTGLNPLTSYYYRIRALYPYGGSVLMGEAQASWKFDNNYDDVSVFNKTLSANNNPTFNAADKMEGTHALQFNGTSHSVNINTTSASNDFLRGTYTEKTVAFWMKSNNNTGNRIVVDIGGSDDGMALRLDANRLYAGIASSNTRVNFFANYTSTAWNHIALVYGNSALRLYVNGVEVASNTALSFLATTTTTNASRIGAVNSSNAFNTGTGFFSGLIDDFGIYSAALTQAQIQALMNNTATSASATTLAGPAAPEIPGPLTATGISASGIQLNWSDLANNESNYEVYRSNTNNSNFVLIKTLPANSNSYTDNNLFATAVFYYKVRAVNIAGNLGFGNEDSARTFSHVPVITPIANQFMRHSSQLQLDVQTTSVLSGAIDIKIDNLPSFGSYTPNGNGTGVLTFNPSAAQQNTYPNITITATDEYGGSSQLSFQLVVNDNYKPEMPSVSNATVNENEVAQINLSATDQNAGDVLTWSFNGLPSFIIPASDNGTAQLTVAPGFADHGVYPVTATVDDGNNGTASRSFSVTVTNVNPNQRIFIDFGDSSLPAGSPWNGTNKMPALNDNFPNFTDENGVVTPVGLRILSAWGAIGNGSNVLGVNTGNNSGLYPDNVIRSAYWTDATHIQTMSIYGLDVNKKYNFTLFGSRSNVADNRTALYTIKGVTASLNAAGNSQNTVSILNIEPDAGGTLTLTLQVGVGSNLAYLNAMVIEAIYEDGSAPAKPKTVAAQLINGATARVTWVDAAYNEMHYQVFRSEVVNGPYTQLNAGSNPNAQLYNDNTVTGNKTYYYFVRASNMNGGTNSDTVSVSTGNGIPVMNVLSNVIMRIQETVDVNINVTDDAGDVITLTAENLPSFATLTDNGNGTGAIHIAPGSIAGIYNNIEITATDDKGANTSRTFRIVVRDIFNSVYVNFSNTTNYPAPSPWNSFTSVPFAGKTLNNMIDDSETPSGINILQADTWEGATDQGAITGNNSGVFPDNVMKTVYYQSNSTPMRVRISGLNTNNTRYNLVFFASRLAADNRSTVYTANGVSVTLNAANNTSNTAQINGLLPDANGIIEVSCTKAPGSTYAYLGALVIQSYVDNGIPFPPANVVAEAKSKTTIELKWSDKSSDEDGFEIHRSESYNGPFTPVFTTAANATTYLNEGLQSGKIYYYKIRTKKGAIFSAFSNIVSTSPFVFSTFINFNRQNNASSPWYNTARAPELGRVFSNLTNDLGNNTGLSMTIEENFNGDNPSGMMTGDNSGVFPDNVLRSSWWVDVGFVAKLRFRNFNKNWAYTFIMTASRNGGGDRTSVYTVNGRSVSVNGAFNSTQVAQLNDIRPNENGEVEMTISLGQYAMFAYLNGMVIHGYKLGDDGSGGGGEGSRSNPVTVDVEVVPANALQDVPAVTRPETPAALVIGTSAFPNPFRDHVSISASFEVAQEKVMIQLVDISGRVVYVKSVGSVSQGVWDHSLDLSKTKLKTGVYTLQIITPDKKLPPATLKLVKTE